MSTTGPFHAGEVAVQRRVGETAVAERNGGVIGGSIVAGAIPFLAQQPMVVVGSLAADGQVWASMLFGEKGFVTASTPQVVRIDVSRSFPVPGDPIWTNVQVYPDVGLIALELATRRRLRINGKMVRSGNVAELAVAQAYPNCPKYIQRRQFVGVDASRREPSFERGTLIGPREAEILRAADTLFIATIHDMTGMDCSHRGGNPGFIEVLTPNEMRVPDYTGNSMYNTLGNLELDPRAGVVVADFDRGEVLQLTGTVTVDWDVPGSDQLTTGTRRFWRMRVDRWVWSRLPVKPLWDYIDPSPFNPDVASPFQEGSS